MPTRKTGNLLPLLILFCVGYSLATMKRDKAHVEAQVIAPVVDIEGQELLEFLDQPPEAEIVGPNGMLGAYLEQDPPAQDLGAEDAEQAAPPPAAETVEIPARLQVRISGPVDSLVGDLVELHAETTAEATTFAWSIDPPVRGLIEMDDGSKAVFSNRTAGHYLVIVSCANSFGDTAHATMAFDLRPAPPENPLTIESLAEANPPPDLRDLIRRWVAEVQTENKAGEASMVAASLRQTANLLVNNQLQITGDGDPLYEVERATEIAVGPQAFQRWASFFGRVRDFLYPLNQKGYISSPLEYSNTFNNLAGELEAIAAGR